MDSTTLTSTVSVSPTSANVSNPIPNMGTHLSLMSYNSTGWGNFKADLIRTLLLSFGVHILAVQEHFQLRDNTFKISKCFNDFDVFSTPATKSNNTVHSGRPSGGLCFIYTNPTSTPA